MDRNLNYQDLYGPTPRRRRAAKQTNTSETWSNLKDGAPYLIGATLFFGCAVMLGTELGDAAVRSINAATAGDLMSNGDAGIQSKWIKVYNDIDPRGWFQ